MSQLISKQAVQRGLDLSDFYLDNIFITSDDNVVLTGERFYITERVVVEQPTSIQRIDYIRNFDDIAVLSLRPDGTIEWTCRVPKRQTSLDRGRHSSYVAFLKNDLLHLYFNDHPDNLQIATGSDTPALEYQDGRNGVLTEFIVGKDGSVEKKHLVNNKEFGMSLIPAWTSTGAFTVLGFEGGRETRYGVMGR
jgi:hypothetical protein